MPPIAPSPQASRAGLITSLVVFVVLFVTATIFAIYFGTQMKASDLALKQSVAKLAPSVTEADLGNPDVAAVNSAAEKQRPMTGILMAIKQRNDFAKIITGNPAAAIDATTNDTSRSITALKAQLTAANVTVALSEDNLLADLKSLGGQIAALAKSLADSQAQTKAANDKVTAAIKERDALLADKDAKIAEGAKAIEQVRAESTKREGEITGNVQEIKKNSDAAVTAAQAQATAAGTELTKASAQIKKLQDSLDRTNAKLAQYRLNTTKPLLHPAGLVTRVPGDNTVFINLGEGEGVSQGLTFEVYDKVKGLPALTAPSGNSMDNGDLPAGKASIEVIRILPGASECRIIKTAGVGIVEGDLILNLIYNTHTKFDFLVYGDFDLANSGQANPGDAEVIRRLVSQWGGKLTDQVNVDTDFIVLGKEPVVTALGDSPTPLDEERHTKQLAAQDAYNNVKSAAIKMNVPILNQNRFLYFVGYYDQAKR